MPVEFWRKATVHSFAHLCFVPYLMQFKNQNKTTPLTFFQGSSLAKPTDALGQFPVFRIIIDISFGIVSQFHYYMHRLASAYNVHCFPELGYHLFFAAFPISVSHLVPKLPILSCCHSSPPVLIPLSVSALATQCAVQKLWIKTIAMFLTVVGWQGVLSQPNGLGWGCKPLHMSGGDSVSAQGRSTWLSASGGLPRLIHMIRSQSAYRGTHTGMGGIWAPFAIYHIPSPSTSISPIFSTERTWLCKQLDRMPYQSLAFLPLPDQD